MTKTEIIAAIAERTGISRADVRLFLDKFNETVVQGLNDDQLVKVKGLGAFRMVSVKARKSVSVNGGEAIEIPAHNKITFTAEKFFAEMVNEPLSHLDVVELTESQSEPDYSIEEEADNFVAPARMRKLNEDAEELKELLADINGSQSTAHVNQQPQTDTSVADEPETPVREPETLEQKPDTITYESSKKVTHGGKIGWIFLCSMILLLVIVGMAYWFYFREKFVKPEEQQVVEVEEDNTVVQSVEVEDNKTIDESVDTLKSENAPSANMTIAQMRNLEIDYSVVQGTETVITGSRLTMISLRAYGDKRFWIHVFLANRDQLSNPSQISPGMVIKIPKMDRRLVDASNPDCLQYAKELEIKYVK